MSSEQDLDRELKAALAVSPSPEFETRVLRRVEADRPSHWPAHYGWFAAAASVIIVAGVLYALNRTASPPTPQIVEHTAPRAFVPRHEGPARKNTSEPPRVEIVRAVRGAPRTAEPEVIVPLNQMEAVRRLVRAVNEGRLEPPAEPLAEPPQGPMPPPTTLGVATLVVEPIPLSPLGPAAETPTPFIRRLK